MKLRRALSDDVFAPFQTFYIKYSKEIEPEVKKVLDEIKKKYATFKYMELHQLLEAYKHYHQIKLNKRKKTFAVLSPIMQQENPQTLPFGCRKITITDKPVKNQGEIYITKDSNLQDVEGLMIKQLKLDSIWVGLLYRIGTDFEQLSKYLVEYEFFQSFQIGFIKQFEVYLEQKLQKNEDFTRQTFDICKRQASQYILLFNQKVEEHIRMKFNTRSVIQDITYHPFLNLLCSRSYFNLIYIQGQILNRYNHYINMKKTVFPSICKEMNLQNFIKLDDYIYTEFIFPCLKFVKKYINRTLDSQPYKQIVQKYHKDIIREFRPSVHQYFLSICLVLKERAACLKEAVGSVIVKNKSIISTGYNGTPMGTINCYNGGCKVCNNSEKMSTEVLSCRCIHAEYNCILTAGITQTIGATLYSSKIPCLWCAKLIIQGQIKQVIYLKSTYSPLQYQNVQLVKQTFKAGKVQLIEMILQFNE